MIVRNRSFHPLLYEGLSTDIKPNTWDAPGNETQPIPPRSNFIETDTGDEYYYTGTKTDDSDAWVKVRTNGAGEAVVITDPTNNDLRANVAMSNRVEGRTNQRVIEENSARIASSLEFMSDQNERILMMLESIAE